MERFTVGLARAGNPSPRHAAKATMELGRQGHEGLRQSPTTRKAHAKRTKEGVVRQHRHAMAKQTNKLSCPVHLSVTVKQMSMQVMVCKKHSSIMALHSHATIFLLHKQQMLSQKVSANHMPCDSVLLPKFMLKLGSVQST